MNWHVLRDRDWDPNEKHLEKDLVYLSWQLNYNPSFPPENHATRSNIPLHESENTSEGFSTASAEGVV